MMAVRVLGCSGSYAAPGGACTGYLMQSQQTNVWLDAGPGTLANLQRHLALADLDAIVLTHAHPDHWLELPIVTNALEWYEPRDRVPVYSNSHMFGEARNLIGEPLSNVFEWHIVSPGDTVEIGDQRWSFAETEHYVPTLAVHVESHGATIAFTSDTGPGFSLADMANKHGAIDLVLAESTFLTRAGNEGVQHLAADEAAALASAAGADRLVLTHQAPREDRDAHRAVAQQGFAGSVVLAEVGELYAAAGD